MTKFALAALAVLVASAGLGVSHAAPRTVFPSPPAVAPIADAVSQVNVTASPLNFTESLQASIAAGMPCMSDSQQAAVDNFFGDGSDTLPRVKLLRNVIYRKGLREGAIPRGTPIEAVNWQGLLQFLQQLMPIIEQMIILFGHGGLGDEQAALIEARAMLCAFEAERPPAVSFAAQTYRKRCGPRGCKLVPVETLNAEADDPQLAEQPAASARPSCARAAATKLPARRHCRRRR